MLTRCLQKNNSCPEFIDYPTRKCIAECPFQVSENISNDFRGRVCVGEYYYRHVELILIVRVD